MDLLCRAYAEEDGEGEAESGGLSMPAAKRPRPQAHYNSHESQIAPVPRNDRRPSSAASAVPGRYVSKRERAMLAAASSSVPPDPAHTQHPPTVITSPVVGNISDSDLPHDVMVSLRSKSKVYARSNKIAGKQAIVLKGHDKAVNSMQWSQSHAHLLASAGMDQTVHVWNVWSKGQQKACAFKYHNAAVKDVRWSSQGMCLLSCGYDCSSRLVDVEKGVETQQFKEDQVVDVIRFHPRDTSLFLSGGSKGFLNLWDIRLGKVVQEYRRGLGPILDIEFSADAKHFISSTDISKSSISENAIIVWDVSRQVPLSNQVYGEAYTCPCIRYHPSDACFVAQSNGNYIAIFSAKPPFKLDKYKRYEKHGVGGFPIKCSFSLDGNELASGSSDGCIYLYNYGTSELLRKIRAFEEPCIDVAFHPVMPNVMASCSWTGEVCVFQ